LTSDRVAHWGALFDELYAGEGAADDPTFDVSGWKSSFTGEPLPAEEMREWLADTVDRLRALAPRNVLEIGCGTGLLVFRLAPGCASYLATDVSRRALEKLGAHLGPLAEQVRLELRPAEDFSGIAPGSLDLVILNSVVQYFPDLAYLEEVLAGALRAVRPGGTVFVGDVRSAALLPAFSAELRRYGRARRETELAVDPARSGSAGPRFRQVTFNVLVGGVPVEGAYVTFRINSGNLIQAGVSTARLLAENIDRTSCCSTRLTPNVASSVSSGRP